MGVGGDPTPTPSLDGRLVLLRNRGLDRDETGGGRESDGPTSFLRYSGLCVLCPFDRSGPSRPCLAIVLFVHLFLFTLPAPPSPVFLAITVLLFRRFCFGIRFLFPLGLGFGRSFCFR